MCLDPQSSRRQMQVLSPVQADRFRHLPLHSSFGDDGLSSPSPEVRGAAALPFVVLTRRPALHAAAGPLATLAFARDAHGDAGNGLRGGAPLSSRRQQKLCGADTTQEEFEKFLAHQLASVGGTQLVFACCVDARRSLPRFDSQQTVHSVRTTS